MNSSKKERAFEDIFYSYKTVSCEALVVRNIGSGLKTLYMTFTQPVRTNYDVIMNTFTGADPVCFVRAITQVIAQIHEAYKSEMDLLFYAETNQMKLKRMNGRDLIHNYACCVLMRLDCRSTNDPDKKYPAVDYTNIELYTDDPYARDEIDRMLF
jgi:hypothetical protein